eukprot:3861564-Ditylum_brightwellii.AAC.1
MHIVTQKDGCEGMRKCKQQHVENNMKETEKRKRDQRGINNPPEMPISHPTHHSMAMQVPKGDSHDQTRPNS